MSLPSIFDPHVHLWMPRSTPRTVTPLVKLFGWSRPIMDLAARLLFPRDALDFVGRIDYVTADYLPADYLRDAAGLDILGVVHVEASWNARHPMGMADETRWLEGLAGGDVIRAIVGAADLASPDLDALLDAHARTSDRFVGVRDKLACSPRRGLMDWTRSPNALTDPAWQEGYGRLGARGLSFDAWMYSPQLKDFTAVAAAHPQTRVVLDHVGTPPGLGGAYGGLSDSERADITARWRDDLAALAELSQVHLKLSGLTMPIAGWGLHEQPPITAAQLAERLGPHIRYALDLFGPERCMFASNFPMDKVSVPLTTLFAAFDSIVADRSEEARQQLFSGTAQRFYRQGDDA
ncbi:MAG: amidohydrolase family protein [Myxococcota bacterium]